MKINVFDIKFKKQPKMEPITIEVDEDADINTEIAKYFKNSCGAVPSFDWDYVEDPADDLEQIRGVLRKYFEGYEEYEPWFSAQDAIDEISAIVGM